MENTKILIVDDDPDLRVVLKTILEGESYVVDTAPGRAEGMEKIQAEKPDLACYRRVLPRDPRSCGLHR